MTLLRIGSRRLVPERALHLGAEKKLDTIYVHDESFNRMEKHMCMLCGDETVPTVLADWHERYGMQLTVDLDRACPSCYEDHTGRAAPPAVDPVIRLQPGKNSAPWIEVLSSDPRHPYVPAGCGVFDLIKREWLCSGLTKSSTVCGEKVYAAQPHQTTRCPNCRSRLRL